MRWKYRFKRWTVGLSAIALAGQACAATCVSEAAGPAQIADRTGRMDTYFLTPRSPQVYRALSGMGDPQLDSAADDTYSRWSSATPAERARAKQLFPGMDVSRQYFYPDFGRCRATSPLRILLDRVTRFGANHPYVKQWISVESAVLSVCGPERKQVQALPPALATQDSAVATLQIKDRAYQQASLLFYSNDIAGALKEFQAIARDQTSPHRGLAAYMAVAIRAGTDPLDEWRAKPTVPPQQSIQEIDAILADPSLADVHAITAQLIGWIGSRGENGAARKAQIHEALSALEAPMQRLKSSGNARLRYGAALTDIGFLHADPADEAWWLNGAVPTDFTASRAMAEAARSDEMAAWFLFPASPYLRHPWAAGEKLRMPAEIARYLRDRPDRPVSDDAWIHEAFSWDPYDSDYAADANKAQQLVDEEIARVERCDDDQALAALPFDFYNLVRQLWMYDSATSRPERFGAALKQLKDFPFKSTIAYRSVVKDSLQYLITKGYLNAARRLRDELKLDDAASRIPETDGLLIVLAEDEDHLVRALATKNYYPREYLNGVSIEELWRLAARGDLGADGRALFARTAWTRLYALGRVIDGSQDRLMRELNPELVKGWRSPAGQDVGPGDRIVLADVLTSPALNLVMESFARMRGSDEAGLTGMDHENHNDNNWWCAWELDRHERDLDDALQGDFGDLDAHPWRYGDRSVRQLLLPALRESFVFRSIDRAQLTALSNVDCAPKLLTQRTIDWVKNPGWLGDRRGQDEALANAIVVARWSCNRQGSHAAYTREAYTLLHKLFSQSAAAKRTKYWYSCPGTQDGCGHADALTAVSQH